MGALFDRWHNQGGNLEVEVNYAEPFRKWSGIYKEQKYEHS